MCIWVSVDSRDFTTVVTISGSDLNTSGDSKQSGMDGLQESILRALLNGLPNKKDQICESYGEKLVECGVDSEKLEEKLKVVQEDEMRKLQRNSSSRNWCKEDSIRERKNKSRCSKSDSEAGGWINEKKRSNSSRT